jgi:ADP-ribose pyrophosphatase
MGEERTIESKHLYRGRVVQLRLDTVVLPNGRTKIREIVVHPGAVAIVPVVNGNVMLVEQYRKAIERTTLEIPAGTLEEGESPKECAERELLEETGYQASQWDKLIEYYPSPGFSSEIIHVFKASGLKKVSDAKELPLHYMGLNEVEAKIRTGELKDSKTIIGVLMMR